MALAKQTASTQLAVWSGLAPTAVAATRGNTQVSLRWTAPTDTGGATLSLDEEQPPRLVLADRYDWADLDPEDFIEKVNQFIDTLTDWYSQVRGLKKSTLVALMKLGARVARFVPGSGKD